MERSNMGPEMVLARVYLAPHSTGLTDALKGVSCQGLYKIVQIELFVF